MQFHTPQNNMAVLSIHNCDEPTTSHHHAQGLRMTEDVVVSFFSCGTNLSLCSGNSNVGYFVSRV